MQNDFIIGQISDTHFVNKNQKLFDKFDTYTRFVDTINTCNKLMKTPDFYIISGDLIHDNEVFYKNFFEDKTGSKAEVQTKKDKFKVVLNFNSSEALKAFVEKLN